MLEFGLHNKDFQEQIFKFTLLDKICLGVNFVVLVLHLEPQFFLDTPINTLENLVAIPSSIVELLETILGSLVFVCMGVILLLLFYGIAIFINTIRHPNARWYQKLLSLLPWINVVLLLMQDSGKP